MEDFKFSREGNNNCALTGYYAASSGNSLPKFRNNFHHHLLLLLLLLLELLTLEEGTDRLSRNGSKELPLLAA